MVNLILISELLISFSLFVHCGAQQFIDHNDVVPMVVAANAIYGYAKEMNDHEDKKGCIRDTNDKSIEVKEYDFKSTKLEGFDLLWCSKADYGYKMWGNGGDNTRACMAKKGKTLLLFFRGTNPISANNWTTNAVKMKMVDVNHHSYNWKKKAKGVSIHMGFINALFTKGSGTIWYAHKGQSQRYSGNKAFRLIDWVQQSIDHDKPTKILVSGHSLG